MRNVNFHISLLIVSTGIFFGTSEKQNRKHGILILHVGLNNLSSGRCPESVIKSKIDHFAYILTGLFQHLFGIKYNNLFDHTWSSLISKSWWIKRFTSASKVVLCYDFFLLFFDNFYDALGSQFWKICPEAEI